jgi:tryptophan synthase alpha chain
MSRISQRFALLQARGEKAFIPYVAAGDPDLATSYQIVTELAAAGADIIELGLPFSDPLADGPTIQAGTQRALKAGTTTDKVFDLVRRLRAGSVATPLCIMTYYNVLLRRGVAAFARQAREAGVDGLIIPDVPLEESADLQAACQAAGLDLIRFVAPTSTPERVAATARAASGFIYAVSLTGVTGERSQLAIDRFRDLVAAAKAHTAVPVCVGFGIATPEQARAVAAVVDGVIVGSALVKLCGQAAPPAEIVAQVGRLARALKQATLPV